MRGTELNQNASSAVTKKHGFAPLRGMKHFRLALPAGIAALLCLLHGFSQAQGAKKSDASDDFFSKGVIPHLRIDIPKASMDVLRRGDGEKTYVRATVREGTNVWEDVGIHIKGAAGSKRAIDSGEPALTLNFDKFKAHQKFHGIDKLHLNNSIQDASLLCEAICSRVFLDAGVPTARSSHARVTLNGRDLGPSRGLYVLKEGYDKEFLRHHFKDATGNLYDGGFIREITEPLQQNSGSGDIARHGDLKALAAAAQDPDPTNRFARLDKLLELDRFLDFIALEIMTWHWDGYALKKNNYRVYHDPSTGRITFIPHGMDQMFWDPNQPIQPAMEGLVARALLQTPEGRLRYRQRMTALLTNVFTAERFTNHIALLQSRLQPALAAISNDKAREQGIAATNLRNAILSRVRTLDRRLNEPPPPPLHFDADGIAAVTKWEIPEAFNPALTAAEKVVATLDISTDPEGHKSLHITALPGRRSVGSWRARVMLDAGNYILEGRVRTAGVTTLTNDVKPPKGIGAGLRLSRATEPRENQLLGDQPWQKLAYEFPVTAGPDEVVVICELRAGAGEAWFDLQSLRLRKKDVAGPKHPQSTSRPSAPP
ncbi:MAG: spore coat protein [Verrucomicrobiota bacterium]|jgi:hypothetical protein